MIPDGFCLRYKGECMIGCDCKTCILNTKADNRTVGEIIRESDDTLADFYCKSMARNVAATWREVCKWDDEQIAKYLKKYFNQIYIAFRTTLDFKEGE